MSRVKRQGKFPTLGRILKFLKETEAAHDDRDDESVCESKPLTRDNFFNAAMWAIIVSGLARRAANTIYDNALECGFPSDWRVLSEWGDEEFNKWCKRMAATKKKPTEDLYGKARDKWWAIWDLAWYISEFDSEDSFQDHFFRGKTEGHDLTDEDIARLKQIKKEEDRLYYIGEANGYFILRNLGGDFLKPDVWIMAFSQWYGDLAVSELVRMLKDQGTHCGRFDLYLWWYCEREVQRTDDLPAHFDRLVADGEI